MKKVLSVVLVLSLMFVLVACGKNAAGEYVLKSITMDGQETKMDDLTALGAPADSFKLVLNDDGTGVLAVMGQEQKLTWDDKALTAEGESISYTLDGDDLTLEQDGDVLVFTRK